MNNKLQLEKLVEFSVATYNNYKINQTSILLDELKEKINKIIVLQSQNEDNNLFKYNYINLHQVLGKHIIPNYDPMILLNPVSFKITEKNMEWGYMLHAFLLLLHDDYLTKDNYIKSSIFRVANEKYKSAIMIPDEFDDNDIQKIANTTGINLVIIDDKNKINIYQNNKFDKWIVLIKLCGQYFPLYDYATKYYTNNCNFIKYLQLLGTVIDVNKPIKLKLEQKYEEIQGSEEESIPFVSEKVSETSQYIKPKNTKKRGTKDIFIPTSPKLTSNDNKEIQAPIPEEQNEMVDYKKMITEFLKTIKPTTKLEKFQEYAEKVGIKLYNGITKDGKPKNRTKQELQGELEKYIK